MCTAPKNPARRHSLIPEKQESARGGVPLNDHSPVDGLRMQMSRGCVREKDRAITSGALAPLVSAQTDFGLSSVMTVDQMTVGYDDRLKRNTGAAEKVGEQPQRADHQELDVLEEGRSFAFDRVTDELADPRDHEERDTGHP
jgi:hypothetical protein